MEVAQHNALANVLRACATFLSLASRWASSLYTADFVASIDIMSEATIIRELSIMLEQCNCEEIEQLYEVGLHLSRAAVIIAGDILGQRGAAGEACVRRLMTQFNHFGKFFYFFFYLNIFIVFFNN